MLHRGFINDKRKKRSTKWNRSSNVRRISPTRPFIKKIDKYIHFSFIRELTKDLYCHTNGRPAVDPVVLFKMLFIGYLYGIRSERQLVKDIEVNLAYRWFLGYSITEKIPDSSTISQNRIWC